MTPHGLTRALRRDDLVLSARDVDVLTTVEQPRDACRDGSGVFHDEEVVLVERNELETSAPEQCLEIFDSICPKRGFVYRYVPLMFGPVQELPVVRYSRTAHAAHCHFTGRVLWDLECWDVQQPWGVARPSDVPSDADKDYGYVDAAGHYHTVYRRRAPATNLASCSTCARRARGPVP